jgi:hypothetical protein
MVEQHIRENGLVSHRRCGPARPVQVKKVNVSWVENKVIAVASLSSNDLAPLADASVTAVVDRITASTAAGNSLVRISSFPQRDWFVSSSPGCRATDASFAGRERFVDGSWERQRETAICASVLEWRSVPWIDLLSGRQPRRRPGGTSPSHLPGPRAATSYRTVGPSICPHEQPIKVPGGARRRPGGRAATAAPLSGGALAG